MEAPGEARYRIMALAANQTGRLAQAFSRGNRSERDGSLVADTRLT